jgi:hypothetical protein
MNTQINTDLIRLRDELVRWSAEIREKENGE